MSNNQIQESPAAISNQEGDPIVRAISRRSFNRTSLSKASDDKARLPCFHRSSALFALTILVASLTYLTGVAVAQQSKPNIVVIWGDDIGWYNLSAYNMGVMGYKTPNIDRIAR